MTYALAATFPAAPEVVYDVLTHPARWLPGDLSADDAGEATGVVRVRLLAPEGGVELSLGYRPAPAARWRAEVSVGPLPAGGTQVDVSVRGEDCDERAAGRVVDEALRGIRREVDEHFAVG
ncbi:hypothetical protein WEI85_32505 [Actinomycetes bacterium KLBMP 9797]